MKFNTKRTVKRSGLTQKYGTMGFLAKLLFTVALLACSQERAFAVTFAGNTFGEWGLPVTPDPTSVISIASHNNGTNNRLSWGVAFPGEFNSYVQFDNANFSTHTNNLFNLGTLTYRNGIIYSDTSFDGDFPLSLGLSFSLPFATNKTFDFLFNILNTLNTTGDPVLDGDRLGFSTSDRSGQTFNYNDRKYVFKPIGFSTDGGKTILSEFNSPEGSIAIASLYGQIISVPEPVSAIGISLLGTYFIVSRRRRQIASDAICSRLGNSKQ